MPFFSHHYENIMLPRIPRRRTTHPTNTTTDEKMPRSVTPFPTHSHLCELLGSLELYKLVKNRRGFIHPNDNSAPSYSLRTTSNTRALTPSNAADQADPGDPSASDLPHSINRLVDSR